MPASSRRTAASETEALLGGPRNHRAARGPSTIRAPTLTEMDLDAILGAQARALVLVDELAHSNAPGSRHPKRYMDVEELLAAGIDVYTTLNIQHVESLNDVVAGITRIRVRETVPDGVIDRADDIEIIDRNTGGSDPPPEGGQGLCAASGGAGDQALFPARQSDRTTRTGACAARRSGSTRRWSTICRRTPSAGPWAANERVLGLHVSGEPGGIAVVRQARRMADRLRAPWTAIHVETSRAARAGEPVRDRLAEALRLAAKLGAEVVTNPGQDVADVVLQYARANNFTHILVAKSDQPGWLDFLRGSVTYRLIRKSGGINVHVIAQQPDVVTDPAPRPAPVRPPIRISEYGGSLAFVAGALAVALVLRQTLAVSSLTLVFLMAVLGSAISYGLWPSLFACLLSVLAYNFFFLPPLYTFVICRPGERGRAVLLRAGRRGDRQQPRRPGVRAQAISPPTARARTTEELYQFSRKLAGIVAAGRSALGYRATRWRLMLKLQAWCCCCRTRTIPKRSRCAPAIPPEDSARRGRPRRRQAWCWQPQAAPPVGAPTRCPAPNACSLPWGTGRGAARRRSASIREKPRLDRTGVLLTPDQRRLLDALSDQAAVWRSNACTARRGCRPRQAAGRDRTPARGAAHLDLARPAHAARLHPRRRQQPRDATMARSSTRPSPWRIAAHHPGGGRAAQPLCCQPARHDPAGERRRWQLRLALSRPISARRWAARTGPRGRKGAGRPYAST